MIQRMSHSAIFVLDQDIAKDFYVNKLGFEVSMDQSMPNGFRWLTVSPKGQSDRQIILMKVAPSPFDGSQVQKIQPQDVETIGGLMKKGAFGAERLSMAEHSRCRRPWGTRSSIRTLISYCTTWVQGMALCRTVDRLQRT